MKKIVDGNNACSKIAYYFSEVCSIYPITPSSPMAANIDKLKDTELLNIFNFKPEIIEMQSEAGAAGAMHGALLSGSLASTFTASQGLLLMIPNMYKMAGEMLPGVIHVAARSLATHALSIFGDHQDIYATRATGFCILASTNVFDAQNLAVVAHLSAIKGSLPFLHFFDGFRTSHELNTIEEFPEDKLLSLVDQDAINTFKSRALNVGHKLQYGMAQNEDIYFQCTEARNQFYNAIPDIVNSYMQEVNKIMKTNYQPFNYYGDKEAKNIIVAMGSVCDTIKNVITKIPHTGLIEVHLYRPFSTKYFLDVLPNTVEKIAVLDKTKENGAPGEPLYLDIASILKETNIKVYGGRYGLSSKNVTPTNIYSVFKMLENNPKHNFTIGIIDDVTNLSLPEYAFDLENKAIETIIYGFGSDGMVSASKDLLKIIHKTNESYVQGYFEYDSKKSGGVTISHLRVGDNPINEPYYVTHPSFVVVTKDIYFRMFDLLDNIKKEGILLINSSKDEQELLKLLPSKIKNIIKERNIKVYYIDAEKIASSHNLKGKISKIMEYLILNIMKIKNCKQSIENGIRISFKTKGEEVINNNIFAIADSLDNLNTLTIENVYEENTVKIINEDVIDLINRRHGYDIPVSKLLPFANGAFPNNTSKYEKRNISNLVPIWQKENCIQCGMCSLVCPHAVIRSILTDNDNGGIPLINSDNLRYQVKIIEADCTGCGLCVNICPGKMKQKALSMHTKINKDGIDFDKYPKLNHNVLKETIKGSQLETPLFAFSGACAGCGETPYIKLLTQIIGEKLVIANATGCSSIYGGSTPSSPYSIPWANSLFEDNAEFALGIYLSYEQKKHQIEHIMKESINSVDKDVQSLFKIWLDNQNDYQVTLNVKNSLSNKLIPNELKNLMDYIPARSVWAIGGDGWAYDIGYGGLDHTLHLNKNLKILVLDTEVYSNTGGQASKSSKMGSVAEFTNFGKRTIKKDLFKIATCIPNCYVASISLGANMQQAIKALNEAEKHDGPAIVIAYCPCIEQGIKTGMSTSIQEEKLSVECGYNILMRYDGQLHLDSKEPNFDKYDEFLDNEVRYNALKIKNPELAKKLLTVQKENAIKRYAMYKKISSSN